MRVRVIMPGPFAGLTGYCRSGPPAPTAGSWCIVDGLHPESRDALHEALRQADDAPYRWAIRS